MRIGSFVVSLVGWLAIPLAAASAASAAPQALGLVAMDRPVPLRCEAGLFQAEFTSFCLQKARAFPGKGTVYEVAETGGLTLRVTEPDGRVREIDAAAYVRICTPRAGHAAVTISLPEAVLAELGGRRAQGNLDAACQRRRSGSAKFHGTRGGGGIAPRARCRPGRRRRHGRAGSRSDRSGQYGAPGDRSPPGRGGAVMGRGVASRAGPGVAGTASCRGPGIRALLGRPGRSSRRLLCERVLAPPA